MDDSAAVVLTGEEKFKVESSSAIVDSLVSHLNRRIHACSEINNRFCFLTDDLDNHLCSACPHPYRHECKSTPHHSILLLACSFHFWRKSFVMGSAQCVFGLPGDRLWSLGIQSLMWVVQLLSCLWTTWPPQLCFDLESTAVTESLRSLIEFYSDDLNEKIFEKWVRWCSPVKQLASKPLS